MKHPMTAALLCLPLLAVAADNEPNPAPQAPVGAETRTWLELQQGGTQAQGAARPMPGEIATHVYQRYADSFKLPIPAEFKRQPAGTDGDSGAR